MSRGTCALWLAVSVVPVLAACDGGSGDPGAVDAGDGSTGGGDAGPPPASDAGPDADGGFAEPYSPRFTDVTAEAGLDHPQWELQSYVACAEDPDEIATLCEARLMTGGATVLDHDGDGWPDLYVTRLDGPDRLYRNRGDGTFEDVAGEVGLGADLPTNGVARGDVDDDGDADLLVTTIDGVRNYLYVRGSDGTYVEQAEVRGVAMVEDQPTALSGACFGDYDLDGWVDLATSEWFPGHLTQRPPPRARLLHNVGAADPGVFETTDVDLADTSYQSGAVSYTPAFADMDGDGWPDLIVVGDFGSTRLLWNEGDGTFVDGTDALGEDVPSDENGMGLAIGDFDGDGRPDWFVTSIFDDRFPCESCFWGRTGNRLYLNAGGRRFVEATGRWDVREGGWGWGAEAFDYDNDGDVDLAMTNGFLPDVPQAEPFFDDPMRLWRNRGGRAPMREESAAAGLVDDRSGKALLTLDYDRDGDLDVLVTNNGATPRLFRNDGPTGHWLRVRATGAGGAAGGTNRAGLGVRVELVVEPGEAPLVQELRGGCDFLGQSENVAHFGLGERATVHEVRVIFPATGLSRVLTDVSADQVLAVDEPDPG